MMIELPQLLLAFFLFFPLAFFVLRNKNGLPTNWPVVGMFPLLLKHVHDMHDYGTEVLEKAKLTYMFKGPWFVKMDMLITVDPSNVRHIMSTNFTNYPKGPRFKEIFDVLGDGIVNTDSDLWLYHRKMVQSFLHRPQVHRYLLNKVWEKAENTLIPILEKASQQGSIIDLQDIFERYTFNTICILTMGDCFDSPSINLPLTTFLKALSDVEVAAVKRFLVPESTWKFIRWLQMGTEKKHREAWKVIDESLYKYIAQKRKILEFKSSTEHQEAQNKDDFEVDDIITIYMTKPKNNIEVEIDSRSDKFLRDTILSYILAGRDTSSALSWFFYLLSKNPQVELKIREELKLVLGTSKTLEDFEKVSGKLIYLHGALCETLRLYPPVVLESKTSVNADTLPSGHKVKPSTHILFDLYVMGRMKSIWGENSHKFEPERWILKDGTIKYEPSHKFLSFNAGPRSCPGKDTAFTEMKLTTAMIIQNYRIEVVDEHLVAPALSFILRMRHGLKVKVFPRNL